MSLMHASWLALSPKVCVVAVQLQNPTTLNGLTDRERDRETEGERQRASTCD